MDWMECEELAMHVLGLDEDSADGADFDNLMEDKFEISMEQFQKVAEALMDLTPVMQSALGRVSYKGFVHDGAFIVKKSA